MTALRKDTSLPFDPVALRAMVSADEVSFSAHRAFVEERCPNPQETVRSPPTSAVEQAGTAAPSPIRRKRKASVDAGQEDITGAQADKLGPHKAKRLREATPEDHLEDSAPTTSEDTKAVKRSRTI